MKIEIWNGHAIRFVLHDDEWWAVLKDVCDALGLKPKRINERLSPEVVSNDLVDTGNGRREMLIVNELGIYDTIFASRKKEAREFKSWVYNMLRQLRQATGLEGFQVFRMLDKEHQKEAMRQLNQGLANPIRESFMKANTIANKAVSNQFGFPRLVKKPDMSPEMLIAREKILDDTVELMTVEDKYHLGISVSETIYRKYN